MYSKGQVPETGTPEKSTFHLLTKFPWAVQQKIIKNSHIELRRKEGERCANKHSDAEYIFSASRFYQEKKKKKIRGVSFFWKKKEENKKKNQQ